MKSYELLNLFSQAKQKVYSARRILLLYPANADPDAFGAAYAMYCFLNSIDKQVFLANYQGNIKSYFKNFPVDLAHLISKKENVSNFDLYISMDGVALERLAIEKEIVKGRIIHFDHHAENEDTEGLIICDPKKASTTELIYDFLKYLNLRISAIIADALVLGILSDTHNFQHGNTTPEVLMKMAELTSISNRAFELNKEYLYRKNLNDLRLLGKALRRMKYFKKQGLVVSVLKREDLVKYKAEHKDMAIIPYFLNTLKGSKFSLLLREKKNGQVKGSLRSEKDKGVNVAAIAQMFQGGGHWAAAGFRLNGELKKVGKKEWRVI